MEIVIKVLQLILSLSLLIFVHELGHYLACRAFGIRVEKFYLFFDAGGFSLFKFKIGETTFGMGWIPVGGYCKISGMVDESMDTAALAAPPQPWEFRSKPAWQRLIVTIGGVVMNVLAACVIYFGMSLRWGESYIDNDDLRWGYAFSELAEEIGFRDGDRVIALDSEPVSGNYKSVLSDMILGQVRSVTIERGSERMDITIPEDRIPEMLNAADFMTARMPFVIGAVAEGMGAEKAGMAVGDSLVALNSMPLEFFDQWKVALTSVAGQTARITVMRDSVGEMVSRVLSVDVSEEGMLGVNPFNEARFFPVQIRHYNLPQAIGAGFRRTGTQIAGYWDQLKLLVNPKTEAYKSVGSFLTIGNFFPGQWDWYVFWYWTAFLSIILAVMNILPIPALDGGHVIFILWEIVTRRKPSDKVLEVAQVIGMILLMGLLLLAFWNDIYRFFIK